MNIIQKYLDQNNVTRSYISKVSGTVPTTLQSVVQSKNSINGLTGKVLIAIDKGIRKTPGTVLDELIKLQENKL